MDLNYYRKKYKANIPQTLFPTVMGVSHLYNHSGNRIYEFADAVTFKPIVVTATLHLPLYITVLVPQSILNESLQANLCLRAFRHDKFQLRMPSHSEGPGIWLSV